jgi:hypothetical protein
MTIHYVTVKGTIRDGKLTATVPQEAIEGEIKIQVPVNGEVPASELPANHKGLDIEALFQALEAFREGMTQEESDELEWAINYKYIEPLEELPELQIGDDE